MNLHPRTPRLVRFAVNGVWFLWLTRPRRRAWSDAGYGRPLVGHRSWNPGG